MKQTYPKTELLLTRMLIIHAVICLITELVMEMRTKYGSLVIHPCSCVHAPWGALQVSNSGFLTLKEQIQYPMSDNECWGQRLPGVLMHCEINFASALTSLLLPRERKIIFQLVFPLVLWYPNLIIQASTCSVHHTPYQSWPAEHLISYSDFVSRRTPSEGESSILVIRCLLPCFGILCMGSFVLWDFH